MHDPLGALDGDARYEPFFAELIKAGHIVVARDSLEVEGHILCIYHLTILTESDSRCVWACDLEFDLDPIAPVVYHTDTLGLLIKLLGQLFPGLFYVVK